MVVALLNAYPIPTAGFRQGTANLIQTSENPRQQRKDTIRLDYRLNGSHQLTYRYSGSDWTAVDAFRGQFPFARTDWSRPNATQIASWTATLRNDLLNEMSYSYSLDEVFINVFTETGLHKRSRTNINYPYIFPGKEIEDKLPTITIAGFNEIDGGPYPAFSRGPIHTFSNTTTLVKGRHSFKAGVVVEYRARMTSTRSTSPPSPAAPTTRTADSSSWTIAPAGRVSRSRMPPWVCSATTRKSANARSPIGARWPPTCSSRTRGRRAIA